MGSVSKERERQREHSFMIFFENSSTTDKVTRVGIHTVDTHQRGLVWLFL